MRPKISPKFHVKNDVKNGKLHANFTLLGRSAEKKEKEKAKKIERERESETARRKAQRARLALAVKGPWDRLLRPVGPLP